MLGSAIGVAKSGVQSMSDLPSVLLPISCGVNLELEHLADQIIVACSGHSKTPFYDSHILSYGKIKPRGSQGKTLAVSSISQYSSGRFERCGIYIRASNPAKPWLNSQSLYLGGRTDLIRRSGVAESNRQHYEDWGTMQSGRWDPYTAAMLMTVVEPEGRLWRDRRRKLRQGTHVHPPWRMRNW